MPISVDSVLTAIALFAAPFLRLSAMMAVAPVFSAAGFNVRTRALFAVLIAALVAPSLPAPPTDSHDTLHRHDQKVARLQLALRRRGPPANRDLAGGRRAHPCA